MDAERPQQPADVVPDRLEAQLQLVCDLLRRATSLQETENLDLSRRQHRIRRRIVRLVDIRYLPEDPDDLVPLAQADGADVALDAPAVGPDHDHLRIAHVCSTCD